jgi:hypothetical protein
VVSSGAGEVVSLLAELNRRLVHVLAAVAEHEVRVAPGGLRSLAVIGVVVAPLKGGLIRLAMRDSLVS